MKRIIYTLLIALPAFTSCSDFLNQDPQGQLTEDTFFGDAEGALMGINGIYSHLRKYDMIGMPWFVMNELPGDNSNTGSELSDGSTARLNSVNNFTYDAGVDELNNWWVGNYNAIASCNVALGSLDVLKDEAVRVRCMAQARFFRGFYYFNLVKAFGGVPLMLEVAQPGQYNKPRASEDEVYDAIIKDLTYAAENLPTRGEWGTKELGRATKGTAQGMLAKVYLFRQDYANAKKYAGFVISDGEYDLHPDYRDLFSPNSVYSNEVMLSDQVMWQESRDQNSEYATFQGVRGHFGWGYMSPTADLADSYEANDPRRAATIFFSGDSVQGKGVIDFMASLDPRANNKTIWPVSFWNSNYFEKSNVHLYFLRFADVLLIYAEAANEEGDTGGALTALERVRNRARLSSPATGVLPEVTERDKARLREIIWNERRIELAMEGHRFADLIRADKVVPGYALQALRADNPNTSFNAARNSRFLIPQKQIDISQGVLTQN